MRNCIFLFAAGLFAQDPLVYTLAGSGPAAPSNYDGAIGSKISLPSVDTAAFDSRGRLFFAAGNVVLRLAKDGTLDHVAGTAKGLFAEGAAAGASRIGQVAALAFDRADNLYCLEKSPSQEFRIRRIDLLGRVTSFGPTLGPDARDMAIAPDGSVYVLAAERGLRISQTGTVDAFAMPPDTTAITFGPDGALYYARRGSIYRRSTSGPDTILFLQNSIGPFGPSGAFRFDQDGNIVFPAADRIQKLTPAGQIKVIAGGAQAGYSGEYGDALNATFRSPTCALPSPEGGVYICDKGNAALRYVDKDGIVRSVAGNGTLEVPRRTVPRRAVDLVNPAIVLDSFGNLYFRSDEGFFRYNDDGTVTYLFGDNSRNDPGETGFASGAPLNFGVTFDPAGSGKAYVTDSFLRKLFLVRPDGTFDHIAGNGEFASTGDGGPALRAAFLPRSTVALPGGDLLIIDGLAGGGSLRKISAATGRISRYSDSTGFTAQMLALDTIPAGAPVPVPWYIARDPAGILYMVGSIPFSASNFRVYRQNADGSWTAIAGQATPSLQPDNGRSLNLNLSYGAGSIGFDRDGNLLFSQFVIDSGPGQVYRFKRDGTYDRIGLPGCFGCDTDSDGFPLARTTLHAGLMTTLPNGDLVFTDDPVSFTGSSSVRVIPARPVDAQVDTAALRFNSTDRHRLVAIRTNQRVPYTVQIATQNGDLWLRTDKRSGLTSDDVDVIISPDGIPFGTYKGNLLITIPAFRPEPFMIPVEMTVP